MVNRIVPVVFAVGSALAVHAAAQKMELTAGRQLLRLDAREVLAEETDVTDAVSDGKNDRVVPVSSPAANVAQFLRAFAVEEGQQAPDVQSLGTHDVVAIGSPSQIARVERTWAGLRKAKDEMFRVEARMCVVPATFIERQLASIARPAADGDRSAPLVAVVDVETAAALVQAMAQEPAAKAVQAPQMSVFHLQQAKVSVGETFCYIREFELEVVGGAQVANPVLSMLYDGQEVEVLCGSLERGEIGLAMQMSSQTVARPLREVKTTVPGSTFEVTVQIPQVTGCRGNQVARIPDRGTALMAARGNDGSWLLSLVTATRLARPGVSTPR